LTSSAPPPLSFFSHLLLFSQTSGTLSLIFSHLSFHSNNETHNKNKEHPLLTLCRRRRNIHRRRTNKHRRRAIVRIEDDAVRRCTNEHRHRVIARIEDATVRRSVSSPPSFRLWCQDPLSSTAIALLAVAVVPGTPMIFLLRRGQICLASRAVMPSPNRRLRGLR
ncbi:hypothetical protein LINPERPRIM_LOCUS33038, partial [Linum perenne]